MIMNYSKYFLMERSPYLGEPPKMIAAELGSALVSGVSGLFGGLFGNKSTSKTNRTNLEIANRYNQTQIDLANMNNKFNRQMWLEQQEYNTPANQMQRYRAAGINPYMALGQMSNGNAESAVTGTMPNTAAPPNMQRKDYSFVGNAAANAAAVALSAANAIKANKEALGQGLQNQYDESTMQSRINLAKYNADAAKWAQEIKKFDFNLYARTFDNQVKLSDLSVNQANQELINKQMEANAMEAQAALYRAQRNLTDTSSKKIKYYLENIAPVELENLRKQGKLIDQQALTEQSKRALNFSSAALNYANVNEINTLLSYKVANMDLENQKLDEAVEFNWMSQADRAGKIAGENWKANSWERKVTIGGKLGVSYNMMMNKHDNVYGAYKQPYQVHQQPFYIRPGVRYNGRQNYHNY